MTGSAGLRGPTTSPDQASPCYCCPRLLAYFSTPSPHPQAAAWADLSTLRGEQWEVGVKYDPRSVRWPHAAFDDLARRTDLQRAGRLHQLADRKRASSSRQGFVGRDLDLIANYHYIDADAQLEGLSKNQASVWAKYASRWPAPPASGRCGLRYLSNFRDRRRRLRRTSSVACSTSAAYATPSGAIAQLNNAPTDLLHHLPGARRLLVRQGPRLVASATTASNPAEKIQDHENSENQTGLGPQWQPGLHRVHAVMCTGCR